MARKENNRFRYIIGIALIIFLFFTIQSYLPNKQIEREHDLINDFLPIQTGTTEDGDVSIELKPIEVSEKLIRLELSANTHSVDLSPFNLNEIIILTSNGKEFNPTSAPQLNGHHASGELIFKGEFDPEKFTIIIKDIPLINERIFSW